MISIDMANGLYDAMKGEIKFTIAYWNILETTKAAAQKLVVSGGYRPCSRHSVKSPEPARTGH